MSTIKKIIRGAGYLPHVGSHPGTGFLLAMILMCAGSGAQRGGLLGFLMGLAFGTLVFFPIYAYGCVDRVDCSERWSAKRSK